MAFLLLSTEPNGTRTSINEKILSWKKNYKSNNAKLYKHDSTWTNRTWVVVVVVVVGRKRNLWHIRITGGAHHSQQIRQLGALNRLLLLMSSCMLILQRFNPVRIKSTCGMWGGWRHRNNLGQWWTSTKN